MPMYETDSGTFELHSIQIPFGSTPDYTSKHVTCDLLEKRIPFIMFPEGIYDNCNES